jgi:hypothetical protein
MTAKKSKKTTGTVPFVGNGLQPSDQLCRKNYKEKLSATCNEFNVKLAKDCKKKQEGIYEQGRSFLVQHPKMAWKLSDEKAEEAMPQVEKAGNT